MIFNKIFRIVAFLGITSQTTYAQLNTIDSITQLQMLDQRVNSERDFKYNYYYNPATMSDYSSSSFSSLEFDYSTKNDRFYRLTDGNKKKSYQLHSKSYKIINNQIKIWGEASYTQLKKSNVSWSENLDFDRISPYLVSDSVKANLDIEKYNFLGGYVQNFNRFSIGIEGQYIAQLGARSRDPRNKTITSNLILKAGTSFQFFQNFKIDGYIAIEKYTQNNRIRFESLLGYPVLYQMNGFGSYNYLFSGGIEQSTTLYEQLGTEYGGTLSHKNGNDFYITFRRGNKNLTKSSNGNFSEAYDLNELKDNLTIVEAGKFFGTNKHRWGIKFNYSNSNRKGYEYGYSNNTSVLETIYKQTSYKRNINQLGSIFFYKYSKEKFSINLLPFAQYESYNERRIRPNSGQRCETVILGITSDIRVEINKNNSIQLKPYFSTRSVLSQDYLFNHEQKESIQNWIWNDYNFLTNNSTSYGGDIAYYVQIQNSPILYLGLNTNYTNIQNKLNKYIGFKIGVSF